MKITVKKQTNKLYANELQTFTHTEAGKQQQRTFAQTTATLRQGAVCAGAVCAGACVQVRVIFAATLHRCSNFAATSQQRTG